MQAVKNGIKCTLRTPGKAALFALILAVLSALVSVAYCGFSAVRGYLKDADEYYHTVAELEFMGEEYPDRNVYDESMAAAVESNAGELDALASHPAVISFEPDVPHIALIDGLKRRDDYVYNSNAAVLAVYIMNETAPGVCYVGIVNKEYSSAKNMDGKLIAVYMNEGVYAETPEVGKTYVMAGSYFRGNGGNVCFQQMKVSFEDRFGEAETPAFEKITSLDIPEDDPFYRLAEVYNIQNNACRVTRTNSIGDLPPFHQQQMKLISGRFFSEEEYRTRAKKVILSDKITGILGLSVGDTLSMKVFGSEGNIYRVAALSEEEAGEYEIVGIFQDVDAYPLWIFLPGNDQTSFRTTAGYTEGSFRLDNDGAADFIKKAAALEKNGFRLTVYDQGYAAATEPMRELLFIATVFLAICLLLAAAALILQSFVFVSRQREAAVTMRRLGSGKAHVMVYFLSAALLLTVIAAVSGCVAGRLVESKVIGLMQDIAARYEGQDLRYSVSRLAVIRTLEFSPNVPLTVYFAAGGTLILGSALSTLIFAFGALSEKKKKKRPAKKPARVREIKTSKLSGPLKYAFVSIRRGRVRTLTVLALTAVTAVFFVRLNASLGDYKTQLEAYKSSTEIFCYGSDLYGRKMDRLLLRPASVLEMMKTDIIDDISATRLIGHCSIIKAEMTEEGLAIEAPGNNHEAESLEISIMRDRPWISTPNIESCPQFRYAKPEIEWAEGYDELDFLSNGPYCALSETTMKEWGFTLGDEVTFYAAVQYQGSTELGLIKLKVIASYKSASSVKTVFSPFRNYYPVTGPDNYQKMFEMYMKAAESYDRHENTPREQIAMIVEEGFLEIEEHEVTYKVINENGVEMTMTGYQSRPEIKLTSFTFKLGDPSRLGELRDTLAEKGFAYVGSYDRLHNYAVIEDEVYLNTVHSMERQIEYVTALYWALYIIAGIIGFTLAWLLTASRRQEIALMRALGTQKLRIILNFFAEQAVLAALGLGVGLLVSLPFGGIEPFALMLSAAFFGLWCLSALICLTVSLFKRSYAALTEPE